MFVCEHFLEFRRGLLSFLVYYFYMGDLGYNKEDQNELWRIWPSRSNLNNNYILPHNTQMFPFKFPLDLKTDQQTTTPEYPSSNPPTFRSNCPTDPQPFFTYYPTQPTYVEPYQQSSPQPYEYYQPQQLQARDPRIRYSEMPKIIQKQPQQQQQQKEQPRSSEGTEFSKSSVSLTTINNGNKSQENDLNLSLAELESKLAFELLSLREEKLTLMQEHNQRTENRYKLQRQLTKLTKKLADMQHDKQQQQEIQYKKIQETRTKATQESQQNAIEYQQLTAQECETMERILNLKQTNNSLMLELFEQENSVADGKNKIMKEGFDTFNAGFTPVKPLSYIQHLRSHKQKLLKTLLSQIPSRPLSQALLHLVSTNQSLNTTLDTYLYGKQHKLQLLRQKVEEEEREKQRILEAIIGIKARVKSMKLENQEIRRALVYFRY